MARGVRKTAMEKLQEELKSVTDAISQYESCMKTLKEKEKLLKEQIELEELKELSGLMKSQEISVEELKSWIAQYQEYRNQEQSA